MQLAETLDLDDFEDVTTTTVTLKNPATGAPTKATIDLAGPEHPDRKKFHMDRARKNRAAFQRSGKIEATDPLDDYEEETGYLVICTVGWQGLTKCGAALPHSAEAARAMYSDPKRQWIRAQVRKAMDETERFISGSAKA